MPAVSTTEIQIQIKIYCEYVKMVSFMACWETPRTGRFLMSHWKTSNKITAISGLGCIDRRDIDWHFEELFLCSRYMVLPGLKNKLQEFMWALRCSWKPNRLFALAVYSFPLKDQKSFCIPVDAEWCPYGTLSVPVYWIALDGKCPRDVEGSGKIVAAWFVS